MEFESHLESFCKNLSTVVEYFLIVGVSPENMREHIENQSDLVPSVISQFPPFSRNEVLIPESIPIFCFPWGVHLSKSPETPTASYLVLTDEKGNKLFCTSLKIWEPNEEVLDSEESTDASRKNNGFYNDTSIYVPKCILIVSKLAFFEIFEKILRKLHVLSQHTTLIPIEWFVGHLVLLIPTPPRGHISVEYKLGDLECHFRLPPLNKLPLLDINLGCLFSCLSLDNIMKLFTCAALEYSIVFLSSEDHKLSACSLAILSLLFPFQWSLVCVPILPEVLKDYLYSPVSYIFGLNTKCKEEVYLRGNESLFIIDLDNDLVQYNAQALKLSSDSYTPVSLPPLPQHYARKLYKRLAKILDPYSHNPQKSFQPIAIDQIRDCFFQFFVSILKNYKKFLSFTTCYDSSCFDEAGFYKECPDNAKPFFQKFFKTQMFANFCETRLRPQNIEEHSENLLFDEHILAKLNRSKLRYSKFQTPFIIDTSQMWKTESVVPEIYAKSDFKGFSYANFPKLSKESMREYPMPKEKPPKFSESIDFPYSSHPDPCQVFHSDKEAVLTCWIQMWAACLWYQDESEHNLRFKELLSALRLLKQVSNFSLTPIYKTLLEAAARINPSLGMPIFKEMTDSQVMVDAATVHLLQKILSLSIKKDQQNAVRKPGNSIFYTTSPINDNAAPNVYRRRVFTKAGDSHIFAKQELCFLIKETCKKCKKFLNIKEIKEGWQSTAYAFESFCIGCRETYIPSLRIRVGLEVGHEQRTSNRENTIFVSPISLKALVKDLLDDQKNKFKLDIELFRVYSAIIFWNLIWHFNDCGLPFEYMLPYEAEVMDVRSSFVIVGEEVVIKKKADKETQTDWTLVNIDQAIKKYNMISQKKIEIC